jgi:murein DD-endopeptidase MepM/ murein hydrolase activator NlpD
LIVAWWALWAGASACTGSSARRDPARSADAAGGVAALRDVVLPLDSAVVQGRIPPRATLAALLGAANVVPADAAAAIERVRELFDLRRLHAGQPFRLVTSVRGAIRRFEYEIDADRLLLVSRSPGGALEAAVQPIPKSRRVEHVVGRIDHASPSLVAAVAALGETIDLTLAIAEILSGEIDFSTEVQPDDRFDVTVEKHYREDQTFGGYGPILAVEFINAGRRVRAVRFTPDGGQPGYYDERGVSMKRFFLASPLKFQPVVTSAFSRSRFHPILREYRPHLGVDYKAPHGAPVIAVADGLVVSAGPNGGSGKMVHLRHTNGYESEYLHLSAISVQRGARIHQGELIGRVGSTGLATGPHLDYRLKKNGAFVNPVAAHRSMPPSEPVPAPQMAAFAAVRDRDFPAAQLLSVESVANPNTAVR